MNVTLAVSTFGNGRLSARVKRPPVFKLRRKLACSPTERKLLANTSFLQIGPRGWGGEGVGGGGENDKTLCVYVCVSVSVQRLHAGENMFTLRGSLNELDLPCREPVCFGLRVKMCQTYKSSSV